VTSRLSRGLVAALVSLLVVTAALLALLPTLGALAVERLALPRVSARLGRAVTAEEVVVRWGSVTLAGLRVDGGGQGLPTLLQLGRVAATVDMLALLRGVVHVDEVELRDLRLSALLLPEANSLSGLREALGRSESGAPPPQPGARRRLEVGSVRIVDGQAAALIDKLGLVRVGAINGTLRFDGLGELRLDRVTVGQPDAAPDDQAAADAATAEAEERAPTEPTASTPHRLSVAQVVARVTLARGRPTGLPTLELHGGTLQPLRGLLLSAIEASLTPDDTVEGRAHLTARGSYAGAEQELWSAAGWVEPGTRSGELRVKAQRFKLAQLAEMLSSPAAQGAARVVQTRNAEVGGELEVKVQGAVGEFKGTGHLAGLTVAHPGLAPIPVPNVGFDASLSGKLDWTRRRLELTALQLDRQSVHAIMTGLIDRTAHVYSATLKVKPVSCQAVLAALPPELVPRLQGFKIDGTFSSDVALQVAWLSPEAALARAAAQKGAPKARAAGHTTTAAALERTAQLAAQQGGLVPVVDLGGKVGIEGCLVKEPAPEVDLQRLQSGFVQTVLLEPGVWRAFWAGPESPDWVSYSDISPHLVNSIMTTEDNGFFKHHGFIVPEFRSALQQNLARGYFRLGASSITMQLVKNVLLSREKTLSRKLQELFLTWYLEKGLEKERILELYFNVIEFGPGIYGISEAARHYFGKHPRDLEPQEAAFFSSILPSPKRRYVQYCHETGLLDAKWDAYVKRIVKKNHERGRLTDEELARALKTPVRFDRAHAVAEKECLAEVKRLTGPPPGEAAATPPPPAKR
jgi:hypothetical protein